MLQSCFIHLPGIGPAMNEKLRQAGILCWADALEKQLPCSASRQNSLRAGVEESLQKLREGDAVWFGNALPAHEQWRLFPSFGQAAAYVDIETSGLQHDCHITTVALYDGASVRTYVYGDNLEAFADDILAYKLLVTWNGRCFDAPILRRSLRIPLDKGDMAHLDLLPVYRKLGYKGGLKAVENRLGLNRDDLEGVDGLDAVRLWLAYEKSNERSYLETLLAYNVADVLSLEFLARYALALQAGQAVYPLPFPDSVRKDLNPYTASPEALKAARRYRFI